MKTEPAHEIAPDHRIKIPIFAQQGQTQIPQDVRDHNHAAEQQINAHKDNFVRLCLESLVPDEETGDAILQNLNQPEAYIPALIAKLDPTKIKLTMRNNMSPTIILPSSSKQDNHKQKGLQRQTGHTLQFYYADHWIGTMTVDYKHDGKIAIDITTAEKS